MSQEAAAQPIGEPLVGRGASVRKTSQENVTMFVQLIALGVVLWGPLLVMMIWMSGNFADLRSEIAELRLEIAGQGLEMQAMEARIFTTLTEKIDALDTRLSAQIQELDARITGLDNKITAIGDMTVIAFTDGEISSEELAAIWERASSAQR